MGIEPKSLLIHANGVTIKSIGNWYRVFIFVTRISLSHNSTFWDSNPKSEKWVTRNPIFGGFTSYSRCKNPKGTLSLFTSLFHFTHLETQHRVSIHAIPEGWDEFVQSILLVHRQGPGKSHTTNYHKGSHCTSTVKVNLLKTPVRPSVLFCLPPLLGSICHACVRPTKFKLFGITLI